MSGSQEDPGGAPLLELSNVAAVTGTDPRVEDEVSAVLSSGEAGGAAVRGGAVRVAGYVLNALLGALAAAFLFRHLGVTKVGIYVTAMSIAAIVAGLSDLGLTTLGVRELSVRNPQGRSELMRNLLGLRIALTLLAIMGSLLFTLIAGYHTIVVAGVALAGAGLMFQNAASTLSLSLVSRLRLTLLTATEVGRQALTTAVTIVFVALGFSLLWFIGLTVPVGALFLVITAWLVRGEVPLIPRLSRAEWRTLARQVLPYSIAVALAVIYFRLSVIFVSLASSGLQLGYFATSFRIIEVLIAIPALMVTAVFPIFAHAAVDDHDRLAYAVSRVFTATLIVGVWFGLAMGLGAPLAVHLIGGAHDFAKAIPVLRIQAIGLAGSFLSSLWAFVLLSLGRLREVIFINLAALIVGSVLVVVLASAYGAHGAALATAITEVVLAASVPLVILHTDRHILPSMSALPRVALAAGLAFAALLIPSLPTIALVTLATLIYGVALLSLRVVPDELIAELRLLPSRLAGRRSAA